MLVITRPASADYLFRVPRAESTVIVNKDGSLTLEYKYEFENLGQPLDYVDIWTPNSSYDLSKITVLSACAYACAGGGR